MIGIDILEIKRLKKLIKNKNFMPKIFCEKEIEYINSKKNKSEVACGLFCAKEAVMKALPNCKEIVFLDIEISHDASGKPVVTLFNNALLKSNEKFNVEISISHSRTVATAICYIN